MSRECDDDDSFIEDPDDVNWVETSLLSSARTLTMMEDDINTEVARGMAGGHPRSDILTNIEDFHERLLVAIDCPSRNGGGNLRGGAKRIQVRLIAELKEKIEEQRSVIGMARRLLSISSSPEPEQQWVELTCVAD
jgi:hypothetical protein